MSYTGKSTHSKLHTKGKSGQRDAKAQSAGTFVPVRAMGRLFWGAVLVLRAGLTPCAYNDTAGQFFAMDRVGKRAGGGLYADGGILVDVALSEFGCATQHDCDTTALCHAERLCSERS